MDATKYFEILKEGEELYDRIHDIDKVERYLISKGISPEAAESFITECILGRHN